MAMFLQLAHTKLNVYQLSQALALECYKITRKFPNDEKLQWYNKSGERLYLSI